MIVNHRRALVLSVVLLLSAIAVGVMVAVPFTKHYVQNVDDAVRRAAVSVQNRPTTLIAEGFSLLGGTWVNWSIRVVALVVLAVRRQFVQLAAFGLAVVSSEMLIGSMKAAYDRPRPPGSLISTSGASFPSGYAIAGAVTAVGLVLVLLPLGRARWRWEARTIADGVRVNAVAPGRVFTEGAVLERITALGNTTLLNRACGAHEHRSRRCRDHAAVRYSWIRPRRTSVRVIVVLAWLLYPGGIDGASGAR